MSRNTELPPLNLSGNQGNSQSFDSSKRGAAQQRISERLTGGTAYQSGSVSSRAPSTPKEQLPGRPSTARDPGRSAIVAAATSVRPSSASSTGRQQGGWNSYTSTASKAAPVAKETLMSRPIQNTFRSDKGSAALVVKSSIPSARREAEAVITTGAVQAETSKREAASSRKILGGSQKLLQAEDFYYKDTNAGYKASFQNPKYTAAGHNQATKTATPFDIRLVKPDINDLGSVLFKSAEGLQNDRYTHRRYDTMRTAVLTSAKGNFQRTSDSYINSLLNPKTAPELSLQATIAGIEELERAIDYRETDLDATTQDRTSIGLGIFLKDRDFDIQNVALFLLKRTVARHKIDLSEMPEASARIFLKTQLRLITDVIVASSEKEVLSATASLESQIGTPKLLQSHQKALDANPELKYAKLVWVAQKKASGKKEIPFALLEPSSLPFDSKVILTGNPKRKELDEAVLSKGQRLALMDLEKAIISQRAGGKPKGRAIKFNAGTGEGKSHLIRQINNFYSDVINVALYDLNSSNESLEKLRTLPAKSEGKPNFVFFDEVFFYGPKFAKLMSGEQLAEPLSAEAVEKNKTAFISSLRSRGIIVALVGASETPDIAQIKVARNRRKMADSYAKLIEHEDTLFDDATSEEDKGALISKIGQEAASIEEREEAIAHMENSVISRIVAKRKELGEDRIDNGSDFTRINKDAVAKYQSLEGRISKLGEQTLYVLPDGSTEGFTRDDFSTICGSAENENNFFVVTPFQINPSNKFTFKIWYKDKDGNIKSEVAEEEKLGDSCARIDTTSPNKSGTRRQRVTLYDHRNYIGGDADSLSLDVGDIFLQFDPNDTKTQDTCVQAIGRSRDKDKTATKIHIFSSEHKAVFIAQIADNTKQQDGWRTQAYLAQKTEGKRKLASEELGSAAQNNKRLESLREEYDKGPEERKQIRKDKLAAELKEQQQQTAALEAQRLARELALRADELTRAMMAQRAEEQIRLLADEKSRHEAEMRKLQEAIQREARLKEEAEAKEREMREASLAQRAALNSEREKALQDIELLRIKTAEELQRRNQELEEQERKEQLAAQQLAQNVKVRGISEILILVDAEIKKMPDLLERSGKLKDALTKHIDPYQQALIAALPNDEDAREESSNKLLSGIAALAAIERTLDEGKQKTQLAQVRVELEKMSREIAEAKELETVPTAAQISLQKQNADKLLAAVRAIVSNATRELDAKSALESTIGSEITSLRQAQMVEPEVEIMRDDSSLRELEALSRQSGMRAREAALLVQQRKVQIDILQKAQQRLRSDLTPKLKDLTRKLTTLHTQLILLPEERQLEDAGGQKFLPHEKYASLDQDKTKAAQELLAIGTALTEIERKIGKADSTQIKEIASQLAEHASSLGKKSVSIVELEDQTRSLSDLVTRELAKIARETGSLAEKLKRQEEQADLARQGARDRLTSLNAAKLDLKERLQETNEAFLTIKIQELLQSEDALNADQEGLENADLDEDDRRAALEKIDALKKEHAGIKAQLNAIAQYLSSSQAPKADKIDDELRTITDHNSTLDSISDNIAQLHQKVLEAIRESEESLTNEEGNDRFAVPALKHDDGFERLPRKFAPKTTRPPTEEVVEDLLEDDEITVPIKTATQPKERPASARPPSTKIPVRVATRPSTAPAKLGDGEAISTEQLGVNISLTKALMKAAKTQFGNKTGEEEATRIYYAKQAEELEKKGATDRNLITDDTKAMLGAENALLRNFCDACVKISACLKALEAKGLGADNAKTRDSLIAEIWNKNSMKRENEFALTDSQKSSLLAMDIALHGEDKKTPNVHNAKCESDNEMSVAVNRMLNTLSGLQSNGAKISEWLEENPIKRFETRKEVADAEFKLPSSIVERPRSPLTDERVQFAAKQLKDAGLEKSTATVMARS